MQEQKSFIFIVIMAFSYAMTSFGVIPQNLKNELPYVPGRILVKIHSDAPINSIDSIVFAVGATKIEEFDLINGLAVYEYDQALDVQDVADRFLENPHVEIAEPDFYQRAALSNDPRFGEEWALENQGQTGGTNDADINAESMWQIENGDPAVVIGIIDTGVDYGHPDLVPNLWRNALEIAGNGIDDDGNGFIDDVFGINAIIGNGNPMDDNSHGTHVAGTIGADGNNQIGISGVAQDVKMVACKFLSSDGSGSTADAIRCLQYFALLKTRANNPVNIVATNNSWGGTGASQALEEAIKAHHNLGILFLAAAGNDSANNDVTSHYPSSYDLANVISVAATDHNDRLASFSTYGRRTVDVSAPGVRILSTVPNNSYALLSGTSMATPHVTGLVAIIKSRFPALDYKQIKNLVISSGTPLAVLANNTISGRRIRGADINGQGALSCDNQVVNSRLKPLSSSANISLGSSIFLSAVRINCSQGGGALTLYSDNTESVILEDNGLNGDAVANDGVYSLNWRPAKAQSYVLNFGGSDIVNVSVSGQNPQLRYRANVVAYNYETIAGTSLQVGDDTYKTLSSPFPIHFNGNAAGYTTINVSSNGLMSFTGTNITGYQNQQLPSSAASTIIAPYWDDLLPSGSNSNVFTALAGTAPNRRYIIEWRNMRQFGASAAGTFQAIFYENSSEIRFNYLDTDFNNSSANQGASATVGVQSSSSEAATFSYNAANVSSMMSLLFKLQ